MRNNPESVNVEKVSRDNEIQVLRISWDGNGWNEDTACIEAEEGSFVSLSEYE